ncbi:MAG: S41 family peptidase [Planctomycetota bacterium]|jgi:hypothetical protein
MTIPRIGLLFLVLVIGPGTTRGQEPLEPNNAVRNFDYVWEALDRHYAQFEAKHVDWDALYRIYRPQVSPETTDAELFIILIRMLRHLNDAHVAIDNGSRRVSAGFIEELSMDDFSVEVVKTKYLRGEFSAAAQGKFIHGWLTDEIGYLHIRNLKGRDLSVPTEAIDAVISEYAGARAMIVDVRANTGGHERATKIVADRFADRRRHYMTTRVRYGEDHGDFDAPRYWYVEPDGPRQFTGPTILLTHRFSESGAEILALAMRVLPHVTVVGDLTGGAFSSQFPIPMPNGWTLWIAYKLVLDHEGVCWDGVGLPPDLRVTNTRTNLDAGTDRVLEFAIQLLERGELKPQDESSSLAVLKTSMAMEFVREVETRGLEAAEAALRQRAATGDERYFFAADEGLRLANDFVNAGRFAEAIVLAEVCRELLPQAASAYGLQAYSHHALGETEAARAVMAAAEAAGVEPMFPWEASLLERVRASLADK